MGDLGSDAGQSALSLGAKALEAILRLFEKLFEAWRRNPERKLAKYRLKDAKTEAERRDILEKLNGKKGFVDYQDLKKSGYELKSIGIYMTKAEMKAFSEVCKRNDILFSGMTDSTSKDANGVKTYEIIFKKQDLEKVERVLAQINDEKRIRYGENRIAEIEGTAAAEGRGLTEQEKNYITDLREEIAVIQKSYCDRLNGEMSEAVIEKAVTGEVQQKLTLDEALNRLTGRHIDKDVVCIVADANDPSKYIKCHGYQDTYNEKEYIKTEYEVFNGSQSVLKTHDGRFDGRPQDYWGEQKAAIQQAGDFSGTFFKFYSVVEYQKWAEAVRNQNTQELSSMVKEGNRDFSGIVKELELQLEKNGAKMQDGVVVDVQTGEPLALSESMTEEQRAIVAESAVIGKQINNYQELSRLEAEVSVEKANVLTTEVGTAERNTAEAKLSSAQGRYDAALQTEKALITERKEINAVQAEQEVRNEPEFNLTGQRSTEIGLTKGELNRDERVDEVGNKEMSMEEVKGKIAEIRANEGAKTNDVKDRLGQDIGAKVANKPSKGHER